MKIRGDVVRIVHRTACVAPLLPYGSSQIASGLQVIYRSPTLWFALLNAVLLRAKIQVESDEAVERLKDAPERP